MGLYEELGEVDVISPVAEMLLTGSVKLFPDGKIRSIYPLLPNVEDPWINVKVAEDRSCFLWHMIYFAQYGIISRNCFNCWKVVFRPRTLDELFQIHKLQKKMDIPCKTGIERRAGSMHKGAYAAFWYGPLGDLEGSRKLRDKVALAVRGEVGIDAKIILKRACTEMEDSAGPSERWKYPEGQRMFEDLLDTTWEVPSSGMMEPRALRVATTRKWIGWAVRNRDQTAKKYYDSMQSFGVVPTTDYSDGKFPDEDLPEVHYASA